MNTASFELCKELYEVSGWDYLELDPYREWSQQWSKWHGQEKYEPFTHARLHGNVLAQPLCPAYDLGYLIRKVGSGGGVISNSDTYTARRPNNYGAGENTDPLHGRIGWDAVTPEDAMCMMIIELFAHGILTKDQA
jgi:hypothetical protein